MPSLRRTMSSPSVRSAPYPTSLSEHAAMLRAQGSGGHKRPSGSESTGRRVLADIEWWRVVDGQQLADVDQDEGEDTAGADERDPEQTPLHVAPAQADISYISWNPAFYDVSEVVIAVAPSTPPRNRYGRDSSSSSLESTPEHLEPIEGVRRDLQYLDLGPHDTPYRMRRRDRRVTGPTFLTIRSHSLADVVSIHNDTPSPYADFTVSPLSSRFIEIAN